MYVGFHTSNFTFIQYIGFFVWLELISAFFTIILHHFLDISSRLDAILGTVLNEIKVKTQLNKTNSLMNILHLTAEIWPRGQLFSHVNYNFCPLKTTFSNYLFFAIRSINFSLNTMTATTRIISELWVNFYIDEVNDPFK